MTEAEFWRIIETTKYASAGDGEKQAALLVDYLSQLSEGKILDFELRYKDFIRTAYDRLLWDAATLINGTCSRDDFMDFRAWLVAQGETIYKAALNNADSLADTIEPQETTFVQSLYLVGMMAYEKRTNGEEMPMINLQKVRLKNEGLSLPDLVSRYPKLYAKFGKR